MPHSAAELDFCLELSVQEHPISLDPHWIPYLSRLPAQTPANLRSWLLDQGSLTKRLVRCSGGSFRVEVLYQGWSKPYLSERLRLNTAPREKVLLREVILYCNEIPTVYARTTIPRGSLTGRLKGLSQLGTKPLGAAIFKEPTLRRQLVDIGKFDAFQLPKPITNFISNEQRYGWGRRSLFTINSCPLLVSEVFLPTVSLLPRQD